MSDPHASVGHNKPETPDKPIDPFDQCVADVMAQLEASSGRVAPMVHEGIKTTVEFFHDEIKMAYDEIAGKRIVGYLKGIDFHSPVSIDTLPVGTRLAQYRPADARDKPFVYYTKPGNSQMVLGINFPSYRYHEVRLAQSAKALQSRASDLAWDGVDRPGGGTQYIISSTIRTKTTYKSGLTGPRWRHRIDAWTNLPAWLVDP